MRIRLRSVPRKAGLLSAVHLSARQQKREEFDVQMLESGESKMACAVAESSSQGQRAANG